MTVKCCDNCEPISGSLIERLNVVAKASSALGYICSTIKKNNTFHVNPQTIRLLEIDQKKNKRTKYCVMVKYVPNKEAFERCEYQVRKTVDFVLFKNASHGKQKQYSMRDIFIEQL